MAKSSLYKITEWIKESLWRIYWNQNRSKHSPLLYFGKSFKKVLFLEFVL